MATLNIKCYDYQEILIFDKVSWVTYSINVCWKTCNLYNISPWCISWLNSLFQVIDITETKHGVYIL